MMVSFARRLFLHLALLLAAVCSASSQQPVAQSLAQDEAKQKAVSYSFVSPNTRENLTLDEAVKLLNSTEEFRLVNYIQRLSICLKVRPVVNKAIGSWSDGAEHSTITRVYTDHSTLLYEDARLGALERQKAFLYFRENSAGEGRMYILSPRRSKKSLASISKSLDKSGVAFRTLVPVSHRRTIIYVVDLKGELQSQVAVAARQLGARLVLVKGMGEFIGDDADREKAQQVFAGIIKDYEDAHPQIGRRCSRAKFH